MIRNKKNYNRHQQAKKELDSILANLGLTKLSEYIGAKTPVKSQCKKGHYISMCLSDYRQSLLAGATGCRICSYAVAQQYRKPLLSDLKLEFEKRGWRLLATEYINAKQKLECVCDKGHYAFINWDNFKQGKGCWECRNISMSLARLGKKHHNYRHDITDEERANRYGRAHNFYKHWSSEVKKMFEFKCAVCASSSNIESHHIWSYTIYKRLRANIYNGTCLCEKCHDKLHSTYGKKNTLNDFISFLELSEPTNISAITLVANNLGILLKEELSFNIRCLLSISLKLKS
jgi:5-methylcytosine-specific restriction endonuclease McrA